MNVPGWMPAIFGENGNVPCLRDIIAGTTGMSWVATGVQPPPASSVKQPLTRAIVVPSSPPRRKPSPSTAISSLTKCTPSRRPVTTGVSEVRNARSTVSGRESYAWLFDAAMTSTTAVPWKSTAPPTWSSFVASIATVIVEKSTNVAGQLTSMLAPPAWPWSLRVAMPHWSSTNDSPPRTSLVPGMTVSGATRDSARLSSPGSGAIEAAQPAAAATYAARSRFTGSRWSGRTSSTSHCTRERPRSNRNPHRSRSAR